MDVSVNEVIKVCLGMGMFVSINQRLDAEAITVIADEFGYDVEFLSAEEEETAPRQPTMRRRPAAPCAYRDHHGPRRPRQNLAA